HAARRSQGPAGQRQPRRADVLCRGAVSPSRSDKPGAVAKPSPAAAAAPFWGAGMVPRNPWALDWIMSVGAALLGLALLVLVFIHHTPSENELTLAEGTRPTAASPNRGTVGGIRPGLWTSLWPGTLPTTRQGHLDSTRCCQPSNAVSRCGCGFGQR